MPKIQQGCEFTEGPQVYVICGARLDGESKIVNLLHVHCSRNSIFNVTAIRAIQGSAVQYENSHILESICVLVWGVFWNICLGVDAREQMAI